MPDKDSQTKTNLKSKSRQKVKTTVQNKMGQRKCETQAKMAIQSRLERAI